MMDVAVAYNKFSSPESGGARESLLTLLEGLSERRPLSVAAYQTPPVDESMDAGFEYTVTSTELRSVPRLVWAGQVVERFQWRRFLAEHLGDDCDLLLTQNRLGPASVDVASEKGIPSLFFVRSLLLTGYEKYSPDRSHLENFRRTDLGGRVQYPLLYLNFEQYREAARTASVTVANSEFTARSLRSLFDVDAEVVYPPVDPEQYEVEYDPDGYVTMVNPRQIYKGPDLFLDVAEALPDEEFLTVGPIGDADLRERAEELPNVTQWGWCEDMREAYGRSRIVLVPSRCEESFGRVAAEAMVSGIPCVVSGRGALPEVVGDTGEVVEDVESTSAWCRAIERAIDDHEPAAQRSRAERYSPEEQADRLEGIVESVCDGE